MIRRVAIFIFCLSALGCSATDLSMSSEAGCTWRPNVAGDDCGPDRIWTRTECAIPMTVPNVDAKCHSPTGSTWSKVWCCEY